MSTDDPFASPPPQRGQWQPDAAPAAPDGGYAAPGYAPAPQVAPGFSAAAPSTPQYSPAPQYATTPQYAAAPQGGPGYGSAPATAPGTDGPSIAALVTGVLGLGVVATVLGAIGLRRTAGGQRRGTGMAWAGVILGLIGTIIWSGAITWGIAGASTFWDEVGTEVGDEFSSEATYGDDPFLDGLWDQCEAGDMAACDDLYYESPFGSEYEDFGWECGGQGRGVLDFDCASKD
ncbi:DUF4190 domain-containing protein [Demequina muriae]|uniref:DUF4190 domain-containing protein n=1 Tax=Demequina muriae TaxID=3051664 RepID=A0ABT8GFD2_9MICO|nr:DUF4190 domain-containing protein [Demequina sp. EGI L300058]MDN4479976.1 hypothetical protein [Demequina sp. EGI L300058]